MIEQVTGHEDGEPERWEVVVEVRDAPHNEER